jgi:hypothetical protein
MKNLQNIVLATVLVVLICLVGYIFLIKKNNNLATQEVSLINEDAVAENNLPSQILGTNWKTYTNTQYGFEIKYPLDWADSIHDSTFILSSTSVVGGDVPTLSINTSGKVQSTEGLINCSTASFAGIPVNKCFTGADWLYQGKTVVISRDSKIPLVIFDNIDDDVSHKILSTFRFTKPLTSINKLPTLVEAKRQEILKATKARDYKKLAGLISSSNFLYLIGPEQGDSNSFELYLRDSDQKNNKSNFDIISTLLNLPYDGFLEGGVKNYVWPDVFLKSPKTWTTEDWNNMEKLYSMKEIESQKLYWNSYAGYRIGIDQNGDWVFYLVGND